MLISVDKKYGQAPFNNEEELEQVVFDNYELIFGPSSILLPKKLIKTAEGFGTIPDAFVIDLESRQWYIVEAELAHHSLWNHITRQVSKQILAAQELVSKKSIIELAMDNYEEEESTKEKFEDLGIKPLKVMKVLEEIIDSQPIIGIPINKISKDLEAWAKTLKYEVKLWIIGKYAEIGNSNNIVYELPDDFEPEIDTDNKLEPKQTYSRSDISIIDLVDAKLLSVGEKLTMKYKPKSSKTGKKYTAEITEKGNLIVLGTEYTSPSYAALACIKDSGSTRNTVNGWKKWKSSSGSIIAELRTKFLENPNRYTIGDTIDLDF